MDMSMQNPWLFELGDMEDQLELLHQLPEMNYFDDVIPEDLAALLGANNQDIQMHHHSLSPSADSSATRLTSPTTSRPTKQPRLQHSSAAARKSSCTSTLPVILNFGSASSMPDTDDDHHQGNITPLQSHRLYQEMQEEKQPFLINGSIRKSDQTPHKRNSSMAKSTTASRDHILAERRRREKITQHLIALSALLPDLKRMDKSSVLGEAVNYIKQLREKVKSLEEDNARKGMESLVAMKKSQIGFEEDDVSSSGDNEDPLKTNNKGQGQDQQEQLSGIEIRVCNVDILLKLQCERREAILPKILSALEKLGLSIATVHATPFGEGTFDITIIAQMGKQINPHNVVGDLSSVIKGF